MKIIIILIITIFNTVAIASPIIIYDSGITIDAKQYYPFEVPSFDKLYQSAKIYKTHNIKIFPIITKNLTPGKLQQYSINLPHLKNSICIIGDDKLSKKWLVLNKDKLKNSICYAVNVKSKQSFNVLEKIVPGLSIVPARGNHLKTLLKINHYPALINSNTITQ